MTRNLERIDGTAPIRRDPQSGRDVHRLQLWRAMSARSGLSTGSRHSSIAGRSRSPLTSGCRYDSGVNSLSHPATTLRIGIAVLLGAWLAACGGRVETRSAPAAVFHTLEGDQLALQAMKHPVLVNFWSTSCSICLHEMPAMARLHDDYAADGFELIAVAMPYDPPNQVLELATEEAWPFPVALDIDGDVLAQFESVEGTPTSFLFDADGQEVARYTGAIDLPALRAELDELLRPETVSGTVRETVPGTVTAPAIGDVRSVRVNAAHQGPG